MVEDYIRKEISNGVALLYLDQKDSKVNIVSPHLIEVFETVVDDILHDDDIKAAVFISSKKDFIAGADIKAFKAEKVGDFQPFSRKGHDLLLRIEKSNKPFVAAIHGTAYGLGVELPLACAARIATSDRNTKFVLPEVKLGLLPWRRDLTITSFSWFASKFRNHAHRKNIFAYKAKIAWLMKLFIQLNCKQLL